MHRLTEEGSNATYLDPILLAGQHLRAGDREVTGDGHLYHASTTPAGEGKTPLRFYTEPPHIEGSNPANTPHTSCRPLLGTEKQHLYHTIYTMEKGGGAVVT